MANALESDSECGGFSDEERDLGLEGSRAEEEAPPAKATKRDKMGQDGEGYLRGVYGQGSRATLYQKKKAVKEWEKEGHKSDNIQALWQRNRDLGLISKPNNQPGPGDNVNSFHPLSEICTVVVLLDPNKRLIMNSVQLLTS